MTATRAARQRMPKTSSVSLSAVCEPVDNELVTVGAEVVTAVAKGTVTLLPRAAFAVLTAAMKVAKRLLDLAAALAATKLAELTYAVKVILTPVRRATTAREITVQPLLVDFVSLSQTLIDMA